MSSAYATGTGSTKKGIAESALTLDDLRVEPAPPQGPDVLVQVLTPPLGRAKS
jgi:hypothetical protein